MSMSKVSPMTVIDEIKTKLNKYPEIKYKEGADYIVVTPSTEQGFEVGLSMINDGYQVNYEGWYERIDTKEGALNYFAFGLSNSYRVKEYRRGGIAYRWTLETKEHDEWVRVGSVGLLFFSFWRKR